MSIYPNLKPIYASSIVHVFALNNSIKFSNIISYDYHDLRSGEESNDYFLFLKDAKNYNDEVQSYWDNLQNFLDKEVNLINSIQANQVIKHCGINFRTRAYPYVQWFLEFERKEIQTTNIYLNEVEPERLEYPIYSLYIFQKPLVIKEITSSMHYSINHSQGIIEYNGNKGDLLEGYESITFMYENVDEK